MSIAWKKYTQWLAGVGIIALVIVYLWRVDYHEVGQYLIQMRWYVPLIILSTATAYLLATMAWRQTFYAVQEKVPSFGKLYVIRHLGEVLTLINPTNIIAGEYSKIYMLKQEGVNRESALTSIVLSRALIILSYFFLFILTFLVFLYDVAFSDALSIWIIVLGVVLSFILLTYLLLSKKLLLYGFVKKILSPFKSGQAILSRIRGMNLGIYRFYQNKKGHFAAAFGLSLLHWVVGTCEFYIILNGLGLECGFMDALVLEMGVMVFKSIGGFIPGQIGIEEYGNLVMLDIIGIPGGEIWLAVSIMRRARQLIWFGIGLIFLWITFKSFKWRFSA